jgi:hypothetical protein
MVRLKVGSCAPLKLRMTGGGMLEKSLMALTNKTIK